MSDDDKSLKLDEMSELHTIMSFAVCHHLSQEVLPQTPQLPGASCILCQAHSA